VATGTAGHGADGGPAPADRAHEPAAPLSADGRALHDRFVAALDDDLDLPAALAVVREVVRAGLPDDERRWLALDADQVLGLDLDRVWSAGPLSGDAALLPEGAARLMADRATARSARDYDRADAIRSELHALGVELTDEPDGSTSWRVVERA
jgi:cysteinyl-tRNA synthetase